MVSNNSKNFFPSLFLFSRIAITILFTAFTLIFSNYSYASINSASNPQDPYKCWNEKAFQFNTNIDEQLFQPIARGYSYMVPGQIRNGVSNFFRNIQEPGIVINDLFQGDYIHALGDSWRFLINSTFGLFGIFDIASHMNKPIAFHQNDFGLTLADWGLTDQKYLVLPFWGPSTDVDALGRIVHYYAFTPYPYIKPWEDTAALLALYYVNGRAQLLQYNSVLEVAALNPYVFQRNAYLQMRQNELQQIKETVHEEYAFLGDKDPGYFLKPSHDYT